MYQPLPHQIPGCLQEFEGLRNSSTCWLREAQSWLAAPRTYTTSKCLHGHANSLKVCLKTKRFKLDFSYLALGCLNMYGFLSVCVDDAG